MEDLAGNLKMADKLWDLANLVTGFAIAQNLAFTYSMAQHDLQVRGRGRHWGAFAGAVVFTIFYVVAVRLCGREGRLLDGGQAHMWCYVTWGRILAIVLFFLVSVVTIYFHRQDEQRGELPGTKGALQ
ncbi:MAG: hypothetical protein ACLQMT_05425 [Candidatus Acidiferrales bacterium]